MAFYRSISQYEPKQARRWIGERLVALRADLKRQITDDRRSDSLIIGSWNIRAFDGGRPRRDESFHYIAEIIDNFDICAIQEIKQDLRPLDRLMNLLGPNWDYFVTDVTSGRKGNSERMAFLYDRRKVFFKNLIGELVLPQDELINDDGLQDQIARTPFFASFQAGWFKFTLCSAHITFGEQSLRVQEINAVAKALQKRSNAEDQVYIFLGDMNISTPDDDTFSALIKNGFDVPLFGPTTLAGKAHYDQIAFTQEGRKTDFIRHGIFDWRTAVFKPDEIDLYREPAETARGKAYAKWNATTYRNWTTQEMSDHLPVWIEIRTDYSDEYLKDKYCC